MATIRLNNLFWVPPRIAGLTGGVSLLLLAMRVLPGEARLWGDVLGANVANGLVFLAGLLLLRWGLFPYSRTALQRAENVLAWLLLFCCCVPFISWISRTGFARVPVLYLAWTVLGFGVASVPSLLGSPATPPRSQTGGRAFLGALACLPLLFTLVSLLLYRGAHARTPVQKPSRVLLWCDLLPADNLVRCPSFSDAPEVLLVIPYARDELNTASQPHLLAQEAISKGYLPVAAPALGGPVHTDKVDRLMDWWEEFQALQDRLVPFERTHHVILPFWHPRETWAVHDLEALLAETRSGFNPGSTDRAEKLLRYLSDQARERQVQLIAFSPFLVLDDLADSDPGLQTALRISVLPPWEWSMIAFPKDPGRASLTAHYTHSALETLGKKAALVLDGTTYLERPGPLRTECAEAMGQGVSDLAFVGLDQLLHGDTQPLKLFLEGIQGPDQGSSRRHSLSVLWQRHLNYLLDLLVVGQRV